MKGSKSCMVNALAYFRALFILSLISLHVTSAAWPFSPSEIKAPKTFDELENKLHLDLVEQTVEKVWKFIEKPGDAAKIAFGGVLLFHGAEFSYLALHLQALRMTGWPSIKRGLLELGSTYKLTREILRSEYPTLVNSKALLEDNNEKIISLKETYKLTSVSMKEGSISEANAKAKMDKLKKDIKDMKAQSAEIEASMSSINALTRAVDPDKSKEILHGIYLGFINSFAVANNQLFAQLSLGYNIGNTMSRVTETIQLRGKGVLEKAQSQSDKVTERLSEQEKKWLKTGVKAAAHSASIAAAVMLENAMLTLGTCLLGGMIVSDILLKHVDPVLEENGLEKLGDNAAKKSLVQYALAGVGFCSQLGIFKNRGILAKVLLLPFVRIDKKMRASFKK